MPSITGVAAYVARARNTLASRRKELEVLMDFNMPPGIARLGKELLLQVVNHAADVASMGRLLGDLRMEEEKAKKRP